MTDPTPESLERARRFKDWRMDKDAIARELDAVQQPLREELEKLEAECYTIMMTCAVCKEYGDGCRCGGVVGLKARVAELRTETRAMADKIAELEKALDRAEALGQSHYQGMHTAKAEVEALRRERDNVAAIRRGGYSKEGPVSE